MKAYDTVLCIAVGLYLIWAALDNYTLKQRVGMLEAEQTFCRPMMKTEAGKLVEAGIWCPKLEAK